MGKRGFVAAERSALGSDDQSVLKQPPCSWSCRWIIGVGLSPGMKDYQSVGQAARSECRVEGQRGQRVPWWAASAECEVGEEESEMRVKNDEENSRMRIVVRVATQTQS